MFLIRFMLKFTLAILTVALALAVLAIATMWLVWWSRRQGATS